MIEIAALYHFIYLPHYQSLRAPLQALCDQHGVKGILLLAQEGFNGTLAGHSEGLHAVLDGIKRATGVDRLEWKSSFSETMPFLRMKVRLKAEIVTIGEVEADPLKAVGTYVEPEDWNAPITDPEILVIDTRNAYETRIGTFQGAIDPGTDSFRDFPAYVRQNLDPARHKKIAMFCTGGIRCEKASAFMLGQGFDEVYHLKGGILKYLERVAPEQSRFEGACFVFDERVAVGQGLKPENYRLCHGCREPLSEADCLHKDYEPGVSCHFCASRLTIEQKASARERQHQINLAKQRGERHLGPRMPD